MVKLFLLYGYTIELVPNKLLTKVKNIKMYNFFAIF